MDVIIPKVALPTQQKPPEQGAVVPVATSTPPENPQDAFHYFDQRDEGQIVEALKGRFLEEYIYSYCRRHRSPDGQRLPGCNCTDAVVGLSWLGVQEAAREYRGIKCPIEKMQKHETADTVEVCLESIDEKTGNSRIGVASQPKKIRLRTGAIVDDEFAISKAVSKAQRNAIRALLPQSLIRAWIEAKLNRTPALPASPMPASIPTPTPAQPTPAPAKTNGVWHPSIAQVKRAFALAFGNNVSRKQLKEIVQKLCGVEDPSLISSRASYEALCTTLQKGGLPA